MSSTNRPEKSSEPSMADLLGLKEKPPFAERTTKAKGRSAFEVAADELLQNLEQGNVSSKLLKDFVSRAKDTVAELDHRLEVLEGRRTRQEQVAFLRNDPIAPQQVSAADARVDSVIPLVAHDASLLADHPNPTPDEAFEQFEQLLSMYRPPRSP
eukprot:Mycagemm_TRINITY_DN10366_c2_g2::TRINITY_DN10366_c2_g2_i2::g.913::m.913 type:complete len:155 gc:universal TRINITY_DN10366_c2_g2_i2:523-59(-)